MAILNAINLVKHYGNEGDEGFTAALRGVSFSIEEGEFIAIMGPSGSGKSTLLNLLSGIDKPSSGEVVIDGQTISMMEGEKIALFRRRQLGFVFQDFNLLDSLTVKENIILPMILEKKEAEVIEKKVKDLTTLFEIDAIVNKYPHSISGGQQQRTAVSRALVNEPSILFADEPTGNLDSKSAAIIMECFEKIVHELSTTVLIVTHDIFTASYCQKIVFIKDGLIHSTIERKGNRKEFLAQIIENLDLVGGKTHVL
ncbi:ABC transporter ATP-binding protein [Neobacillus sp. SCS-31]|uniref:ABC transporter ATP-binding protein n=1 Tax=Neobacillus oceani TaxID=3115292 RepID=UPI003906B2C5